MGIKVEVVDAPVTKGRYEKWLERVLTLPEGKALLISGLTLKEALCIRSASSRFWKFHTKISADGDTFKLYLSRRE